MDNNGIAVSRPIPWRDGTNCTFDDFEIMRYPFLASALFALCGSVMAAIAYAAPFGNTGVDGSAGALLALLGAVATTAGVALLATTRVYGNLVPILAGLSLLAAMLTAIAAYFLLQFVFAALMVGAFLCLVLALFLSSRPGAS